MNAKIKKEMREHPERFDFGDVPKARFSPEYSAEISANMPDWFKELIEENRADKAIVVGLQNKAPDPAL